MRAWVLLICFVMGATAAEPSGKLREILDRVSEEAAVFSNRAQKIIGRETLRQRAAKRRRRFRLRIGKDATNAPPIRFQTREIVSEYGFTTFREDPGSLYELRTVVSVDGRQTASDGKARETLTIGATKPDDRLKKRLLKRFQKHGLSGVATDFGQMVLLFERRQLADYEFQIIREVFLGAEKAIVLSYRQLQGSDAVTIFEGRKSVKAPLAGELWVRAFDFLPLRVKTLTTIEEKKHTTQHRGVVDYQQSEYGVILPISVRYEKLVDDNLVVENVATYTDFQMFSVDAEIKFTPVEP